LPLFGLPDFFFFFNFFFLIPGKCFPSGQLVPFSSSVLSFILYMSEQETVLYVKKKMLSFWDPLIGSGKHFSGGSGSDNCKDVDVVSVLPECSTSTATDSLGLEMVSDRRLPDNAFNKSRFRTQEDPPLDYDSVHDGMSMSSSVFEFQKAERGAQRGPLGPFSKPAPSKWDDAQKWIASPTSNRPKMGLAQVHGEQGIGSRKTASVGYGSWQPSTKVVVEVLDQSVVPFGEPDTKRIDTSQAKMNSAGTKCVSWEDDHSYPIPDSYGQSVLMIENSVGESASKNLFIVKIGSYSPLSFVAMHVIEVSSWILWILTFLAEKSLTLCTMQLH
jgi:hypothetical protein